MSIDQHKAILQQLDFERRTNYVQSRARSESAIVRDISSDGGLCEIVFSSSAPDEVDQLIALETQRARSAGYTLEWKVYGHDSPQSLSDRLIEAGFQPQSREAFMVATIDQKLLDAFGEPTADIREITTASYLANYRTVRESVSGEDCTAEMERYASLFATSPRNMSVYVAYVADDPAACGRLYCCDGSKFAALYGGQTIEKHRRQGLYTQLTAIRLREAMSKGFPYAFVDAMPTSEPILAKRGFERITFVQAFILDPFS